MLPLAALGASVGRRSGIALFYHYDAAIGKRDRLGRFVDKRAWDGLRAASAVVVIAEYWRRFLIERGVRNPVVIHTPFELGHYRVTPEEVAAFRRELGLSRRPLVYLGNCRPNKGTREAWEVLRDRGYGLVTSGPKQLDLPVPNLDGTLRDYILLLAASDVVLTMSTFDEGWNRTAHEAMLVGTPVIGSGRGGMRELLEGGRQLVCETFEDLPTMVETALGDRERIGQDGRAFAEQFSFTRFGHQWREVVSSVLHD